jgi:hypothetical protein
MANDFYTPGEAAVVAAKLVGEDAVLSALISRNYAEDLMGGGKGGAPISVLLPTTLIARERGINDVTTPIVLDEIAERRETFNLDRVHDYSAVGVSEADLTLNLQDFTRQVLAPQAAALADALEHKVAAAFDDLTVAGNGTLDPANPLPYFTRLRKRLRQRGVDPSALTIVAGVDVYATLLDANVITDVASSGSTAALREAQIGKLRGFTIIESTRVAETEILVFHRDAATLITRAPVAPQGASFAATTTAGGFQLRYLRDYDAMHTQDRSIVSTFSAVGFLPTYRVRRDYDTRQVVVEKLAKGGVMRLDTENTEALPVDPWETVSTRTV